MNKYIEYLDGITVDDEQHGRIMKLLNQKPHRLRQKRTIYQYAGLAACLAIVLLCIWAMPGMFDNPVVVSPGNTGLTVQAPPQNGGVTVEPSEPTNTPEPTEPVYPLYSLTLNYVDSLISSERAYIPGHFWYELTDEQLRAVFPDFPLTLTATAHYFGDGSLHSVVAYDNETWGANDEYLTFTKIEVVGAGGGSMRDYSYVDSEPIISDVAGILVTAETVRGMPIYMAAFVMDEVTYDITIEVNNLEESGYNRGQDRLTEVVNALIRNGPADLSVLNDPVIPELRDESLTLSEARSDPDFGMYLPENVPSRFGFESARRFINQDTDNLSVYWSIRFDYDYIDWRVSKATDYDLERIASPDERVKYDMELYPIPWADSVPTELRDYVLNPVFRAEDLTLDIIQARAYWVDTDRSDTPGWRMRFSVLYGDAVVEVNVKGASPEQVWEMFNRMISYY
ncbi:MAG: hypothetical protein LBI27_06415 [Clostridiales bacterium]|jgi:hypothetical protein|nr:hypothetical protein [Clostridiales bacterium]